MKDFGRWFNEQALMEPATPPVGEDFPDGVDEMKDGTFGLRCCMCGQSFIADWLTHEEALQLDPGDQYCGGRPGCTP